MAEFGISGKIFDKICTFWWMKDGIFGGKIVCSLLIYHRRMKSFYCAAVFRFFCSFSSIIKQIILFIKIDVLLVGSSLTELRNLLVIGALSPTTATRWHTTVGLTKKMCNVIHSMIHNSTWVSCFKIFHITAAFNPWLCQFDRQFARDKFWLDSTITNRWSSSGADAELVSVHWHWSHPM